jgi:hypothetical protein
MRMAEELGTSVIEEKGTRDTVPHPAVLGNSFGHRSTNEPGTRVIYPGSCSRCKRFWEQPRQHLGLASAEIFRRTPTPNPRPWGGLFCMSERYSWRLTEGMPVGRSEGKPH